MPNDLGILSRPFTRGDEWRTGGTLLCVDIKMQPILPSETQIFFMKSSDCVEDTMAERDPAGKRDMATKRVVALDIQAVFLWIIN